MTKRFHMYLTAGLMLMAPAMASAQPPSLQASAALMPSFSPEQRSCPDRTRWSLLINGIGVGTFADGKLTGTESANFGTFVLRNAPVSSDYTLNGDFTGSMTTTFPDGSTGHSDFVITNGAKTIYAISVDSVGPGSITTLTATKIRANR